MSLLLAIFMLFSNAFALTTNTEYYVCASSCYLYEDASFDANKVKIDDKDLILKHGNSVILESEGEAFAYVKVKDNNLEGYVYKYYISSKSAVEYYPVFNATIREDTLVYDINQNETEYSVKKNQRVYLYKGFNDKETYTPVQIVLDDGHVYNGYVLTEKIKPDGVSHVLIIAIPLIAALVTVILSVVLIKKKKKKKRGSKA